MKNKRLIGIIAALAVLVAGSLIYSCLLYTSETEFFKK